MTQCPSTAQVMPGGAIIRCELELGHDEPIVAIDPWDMSRRIVREATPHRCALEWANPEGVVIDPELYDPDETFDLEVDIDPAVELGLCGEVVTVTYSGAVSTFTCTKSEGHPGEHRDHGERASWER